jgi:hypothetical protein
MGVGLLTLPAAPVRACFAGPCSVAWGAGELPLRGLRDGSGAEGRSEPFEGSHLNDSHGRHRRPTGSWR